MLEDKKFGRGFVLGVSTVLVVGGLGFGVGQAQSSSSGSSPAAKGLATDAIYIACVDKKTKNMRFLSKCKKSEKRITWGQAGPMGPAGVSGANGQNGSNGLDGATGPQGVQGDRGERGEQGVQGTQGIQGAQGIQGEQGPAGTSGVGSSGLVTGGFKSGIDPVNNPGSTGYERGSISEFGIPAVDGENYRTIVPNQDIKVNNLVARIENDVPNGGSVSIYVSYSTSGYGETTAISCTITGTAASGETKCDSGAQRATIPAGAFIWGTVTVTGTASGSNNPVSATWGFATSPA